MPISDRIERAKSVTKELTYKVLDVIDLHEANKIISFSDKLATQVPRSYAASAFAVFQNAMFTSEVIKCIALWDRADDNVISIPTVVDLINDAGVLTALVAETRSAHMAREPRSLNPSNDPDIKTAIDKAIVHSQKRFAEDQAKRAYAGLVGALEKSREIIQREQTGSIKNLRDHLAHNLTQTRAEQRSIVPNMKYGDEKHLLEVSIRIIEDLYCWVNGTSFDIGGDCVGHAKVRAEELWLNCRFSIPSR
ncbi:hypothetical protein [uncultured Tateyamaria sp.]|uniref:AbiU2 domain-containing protein n=1 Tax=uncultured Tateyamaria sp. TaxID=455651 RepID=UPI002603A4F9|nr:hypothetical protein [uncultured Tateyamaria sp.]